MLNTVIRFPRFVVSVVFLLTILFCYFLPKISIQKTIDIFYDKRSPTYKEFQRWKGVFGSDDRIIIAWQDKDLFTKKGLEKIKSVSSALEALDGIDKVQSLATVSDIKADDFAFYVAPPLEQIPSDSKQLKLLKERILQNPIFLHNFISPDGKTTSIIVFLDAESNLPKEVIIKDIISLLKKQLKGFRYHISGSAVIDYYYTKYMEDDLKVFMPIVLLLVFLVLLYSFRNLAGVLFPFITIVTSLIWTMSLLYFFNFPLNNVTTIVPPIIVAISIADSIHFVAEIIQRHYRHNIPIDEYLVSQTMRDLLLPCSMTSITTSVGFFSLLVSRIEPVRQLGIVAGIGVLFALVITFTLLPSLLVLFPNMISTLKPKMEDKRGSFVDLFLEKIAVYTQRFGIYIVGFSVLAVAVSVFFAMRIKTETSMINYFKKTTEVYKSTVFIQERLGGIHFLNLSLRTAKRDYFKDPVVLKKIELLEQFVSSMPKVDQVISITEYIKLMNKAFHKDDIRFYRLPEKSSTISQYLLLYDAGDISDFINDDWSWATVRIRVSENSSMKIMKMVEKLQSYLRQIFPTSEVASSVVGISVLEAETNELVTQSQIRSLSLAFLIIFLLMFVVFRSVKVGLLSMVPNVIPLIFNFGIMGALRINLDSATSMISAVGIGIIVDDTIHFLHTFLKAIKEYNFANAIKYTLMEKGRPIIFTSVILFFGFIVLILSKFSPTSAFGILTSMLMLNALIADIIILPAILFLLSEIFNNVKRVRGGVKR